MQSAAGVGGVQFGDARRRTEDGRQVGHELHEHAGQRRHPGVQPVAPPVPLGRRGCVHGVHERAERVPQRGVGCRRAVSAPSVAEDAVAVGDFTAECLDQSRLPDAGYAAEQDACPVTARRVDGRSQLCEFALAVDHPAVEVV